MDLVYIWKQETPAMRTDKIISVDVVSVFFLVVYSDYPFISCSKYAFCFALDPKDLYHSIVDFPDTLNVRWGFSPRIALASARNCLAACSGVVRPKSSWS